MSESPSGTMRRLPHSEPRSRERPTYPALRGPETYAIRPSKPLAGILSGARPRFPAARSLAESSNAGAWAVAQTVRAIQTWTLGQARRRAPPIPVADSSGRER